MSANGCHPRSHCQLINRYRTRGGHRAVGRVHMCQRSRTHLRRSNSSTTTCSSSTT